MEQSNVLLVLMCLDLTDPNPLGSRSKLYLDESPDKPYQLLAAVLDPLHRATSAPVKGIALTGDKKRTYNNILRQFQEISETFYEKNGFVNHPDIYTDERQAEVEDAMSNVGRDIYDLFQTDDGGPNPVRDWLDRLLGARNSGARQRPTRPVTILSNDFGIPWFWLKREKTKSFLCEVCALGLLQLSAVRAAEIHQAPPGQQDKTYEALLIRGSTTLPFDEEELNTIRALVSEPDQRATRSFTAALAETKDDIWHLLRQGEAKLLDDFRIVHFSGHYSDKELLLGGDPLPITMLQDMLSGSLLVLDGCSSGSKLNAWADVEGLTSALINKGALGCVVTVLPVKNDPIVSKVLWGAFYGELRRGSSTVGQALAQARNKLRDHFDAIGSSNPSWAVYQLIGSPAVQLCDIEDEADG
jgi:hypothetical protein